MLERRKKTYRSVIIACYFPFHLSSAIFTSCKFSLHSQWLQKNARHALVELRVKRVASSVMPRYAIIAYANVTSAVRTFASSAQ